MCYRGLFRSFKGEKLFNKLFCCETLPVNAVEALERKKTDVKIFFIGVPLIFV